MIVCKEQIDNNVLAYPGRVCVTKFVYLNSRTLLWSCGKTEG